MKKAITFCLLACVLCIAIPWASATTVEYAVADVGYNLQPEDINDNAQIVGWQETSQVDPYPDYILQHVYRGFLWENGTLTDIGTLGVGTSCQAHGINNEGQIVGWSRFETSSRKHGFVWHDGAMTDIGPEEGMSWANDINESGVIAGWIGTPSVGGACYWDSSGFHALGTLGGNFSWAYGINDLGDVVGYSAKTSWGFHAFLWHDGIMGDLNPTTGVYAAAHAVNNKGQAVGYVDSPYTNTAYLWDNGQMTMLGNLGGHWCEAYDINDSSQIVGYSQIPILNPHAVIWENGLTRDINPSGWTFSVAKAINDKGQIVGHGYNGSENRAFMLTPTLIVPMDIEPRDSLNVIKLGSGGWTIVLISSDSGFNAATIDVSTVQFAGAQPSRWVDRDTDRDGDVDMTFYFKTKALNLTASDTEATLTGVTTSGKTFRGTDIVTVL